MIAHGYWLTVHPSFSRANEKWYLFSFSFASSGQIRRIPMRCLFGHLKGNFGEKKKAETVVSRFCSMFWLPNHDFYDKMHVSMSIIRRIGLEFFDSHVSQPLRPAIETKQRQMLCEKRWAANGTRLLKCGEKILIVFMQITDAITLLWYDVSVTSFRLSTKRNFFPVVRFLNVLFRSLSLSFSFCCDCHKHVFNAWIHRSLAYGVVSALQWSCAYTRLAHKSD